MKFKCLFLIITLSSINLNYPMQQPSNQKTAIDRILDRYREKNMMAPWHVIGWMQSIIKPYALAYNQQLTAQQIR